ncbi:hypothetical protein I4U23_015474 [Adineta vaga]|nr:hypothetical protein I4U23_015474 [Adineta vaga]
MVNECNTIESNRCSIVYSNPIVRILSNKSNSIQLTTKNNTSQLIAFIDKYRGLRQLHYDCSSKVLLFFNTSWWNKQENITNGRSITDLPIRFIYYPNNNMPVDGGTILASLIEIHRFSSNLRDYFQDGKVKHWCSDAYTHGAFALFTPFQETEIIDELYTTISNLHFIADYTMIIGSGPIGLMASVYLSIKQTCEKLELNCEYLNNTQLKQRYQGMFHNQSGYINVTLLRKSLLEIVRQHPNIILHDHEEFLSLKLVALNRTEIITDRGILYASKKVLFVPGPYAKNI